MSEREKMLRGELYDPSDLELKSLRVKARKLARKYNLTDEDESERREAILAELLPNTVHLPSLQASIYFDYCGAFAPGDSVSEDACAARRKGFLRPDAG